EAEAAAATTEVAPALDTAPWGQELPDAVTAVSQDGLALYVGTRFLGAAEVKADGLEFFRTSDITKDAVRLTVACQDQNDCYVATGSARAWHFDGKSFDPANID